MTNHVGYVSSNLPSRIDLAALRRMRADGHPIAMLTCYDYSTARVLADTGVHVLLVGDSAANTILGETSTVPIALDFLVTLTRAVRRAAPHLFVMGDMPFASYPDPVTAVVNAARFLKEAGADAVKLEVDGRHQAIVAALSTAGIPVCAHLGLLPQRAPQQGGYKAQGRTSPEAERIINDAELLVGAGADLLLIEAVPNEVSARVVERVGVPVFGCGGGSSCHGHVVVLHDLLGFSARPPRFVEPLVDVPALIRQAASTYAQRVASREYPAPRHQYQMKSDTKSPSVSEPK